MSDESNSEKSLPIGKTSRRRFVSVASGVTAGLAFAARAFAGDSQQRDGQEDEEEVQARG